MPLEMVGRACETVMQTQMAGSVRKFWVGPQACTQSEESAFLGIMPSTAHSQQQLFGLNSSAPQQT
eukprot:1159374-Pelagomonas_calceolata.AAC.13